MSSSLLEVCFQTWSFGLNLGSPQVGAEGDARAAILLQHHADDLEQDPEAHPEHHREADDPAQHDQGPQPGSRKAKGVEDQDARNASTRPDHRQQGVRVEDRLEEGTGHRREHDEQEVAQGSQHFLRVVPEDEQEGVRGSLAESLKGVVAQQLLKRKEGGRVAALEILFGTSGLSSMIRDGKTTQITSSIQMGKNIGMQAMDDALWQLLEEDLVTPESAYEKVVDKGAFRDRLSDAGITITD